MRIVRYATLTLVAVAVATTSLFAQWSEPVVSLSATAGIRALNYASGEPETAMVFADRTLIRIPVRLALGNSTGSDVEVGVSERRWTDFVSVETFVSRDDQREQIAGQVQLSTSVAPGSMRLQHNRSHTVRGALVRLDGRPFDPGLYEVRVSLANGALNSAARRQGNLLSSTIRIRIKEPKTPGEIADAYLQQSYAARLEGRIPESRQWASRVLSLNQFSIPAILDIASAWLDEGSCVRAAPEYQRAIALLESGADPELAVNESEREEWATSLRGKLESRCSVR